MANKTPLTSWLYSKRQELNPQFKELNWPTQIYPGLFDFSTTISWNGVESSGRGVDLQREIALEKSVAEAIERLICISIGFDSVGFAVAGTHDPTDHAKFEAMERYFLNQHIKNRIPFSQVSGEVENVQKFRKSNPGAVLNFFRMRTPSQFYGIVCAMKSEKSEITALGFALSESLERSVQRSLQEALPNFAWLNDDNRNLEAEMPWHIEPNFLAQLEPLLSHHTIETPDMDWEPPTLQQVHVDTSRISVLSSAPIWLARFSAATQELK